MKVGLVGKPNAGKSTFFTAVTSASAQIGDYPFTTIDKNVGIAHVRKPCPSKELGVESNPNNSLSINGIRYIPVEVIDVAGLVPDAHKGKGMGNKFLDDLRQADVLIQVVDSSGTTDLEGNTTEGADPTDEIDFLRTQWAATVIEHFKLIGAALRCLIRHTSMLGLTVSNFNLLSAEALVFPRNPLGAVLLWL